ncbi:hypothetical protein M422DRAFT_238193 [Sphaerobolus stellatus SS14]|nr:hypothetical protein M422DRAFT_238193 [Sphaerobolus stellatus SS14]
MAAARPRFRMVYRSAGDAGLGGGYHGRLSAKDREPKRRPYAQPQRVVYHTHSNSASSMLLRPRATRLYSSAPRRNPHADWYSQILPAMLPIALLGSSVYLGLHLIRTNLATERRADLCDARIIQLEEELAQLQRKQ